MCLHCSVLNYSVTTLYISSVNYQNNGSDDFECFCVLSCRFAQHFLQLEVIKGSVASSVIEVTFPVLCMVPESCVTNN